MIQPFIILIIKSRFYIKILIPVWAPWCRLALVHFGSPVNVCINMFAIFPLIKGSVKVFFKGKSRRNNFSNLLRDVFALLFWHILTALLGNLKSSDDVNFILYIK